MWNLFSEPKQPTWWDYIYSDAANNDAEQNAWLINLAGITVTAAALGAILYKKYFAKQNVNTQDEAISEQNKNGEIRAILQGLLTLAKDAREFKNGAEDLQQQIKAVTEGKKPLLSEEDKKILVTTGKDILATAVKHAGNCVLDAADAALNSTDEPKQQRKRKGSKPNPCTIM